VLHRCGFDIAYKTSNNKVACVQIGSGSDITSDGSALWKRYPTKGEIPEKVVVVCGDTWWNSKFRLEAIALEENGDLPLVDNATYTPSGGWGKDWPLFFANVAIRYRPLAFKSVWRWYRVKQLSQGGFTPHGSTEASFKIEDLLPLAPHQAGAGTHQDYWKWNLETSVWGQRWLYSLHPSDCGPCLLQADQYDLDWRHGVVKFHWPVISLDGGCPSEPELYLNAMHRQRKDDGRYVRKEFE